MSGRDKGVQIYIYIYIYYLFIEEKREKKYKEIKCTGKNMIKNRRVKKRKERMLELGEVYPRSAMPAQAHIAIYTPRYKSLP